jgi:hypothetical protein
MELGLLIPILALMIPIVAIWTKHQQSLERMRIEAGRRHGESRDSEQAERTAELEERVQVLERIVTDRGYDLAAQIEALRDERRVEERQGQRSGIQ